MAKRRFLYVNPKPQFARVSRTTNQTISNNTLTRIQFPNVNAVTPILSYDTINHQFIVLQPAIYSLFVRLPLGTSTAGTRTIFYNISGLRYVNAQTPLSFTTYYNHHMILPLATNNTIGVDLYQTSGANINVLGASLPYFIITKIGDL